MLIADEAAVWSAAGGPDAGAFVIDRTSGTLRFANPPDFDAPADANGENIYVVVISATDSMGNTSAITLTIVVFAVGEPDVTSPVIEGAVDQRISLPEGQIFVASLRANERVTWAIPDGADRAALRIDPISGDVRFADAPDFDMPADANGDNIYSIRILATDAANNTSTVNLSVTILDLDDTVAGIYDHVSDDVAQIVTEVEINHLQSSVASLQEMMTTARDRFIAARQMHGRCNGSDAAAIHSDAACSRIATRNWVPFRVHGQAQYGTNGSNAAGTFYGQTGDFAGTRRRIVSGDFSIVDNEAGVATINMTARILWERLVSDGVMLGYFVSGTFGQSTIDKRLHGRADQVSLSMGPYFVAALNDTLQLDGFLSFGASRNTLGLRNVDIRLDGAYAAQSMVMGMALSGAIDGGGYQLRPEIAVAYGVTHIGTVRLTAAAAGMDGMVTSPARTVDFAQLSITPEMRIPVYTNSDVASYVLAPSLFCDWTNGARQCGGSLRLGLQGTSPDQRARFDIAVNADRIGGKDRVGLRANVEYRF